MESQYFLETCDASVVTITALIQYIYEKTKLLI